MSLPASATPESLARAAGLLLVRHLQKTEADLFDRWAKAAKADGRGKAYSMMIRSKIPGGKMTSDQLLAEMDLADEIGNHRRTIIRQLEKIKKIDYL